MRGKNLHIVELEVDILGVKKVDIIDKRQGPDPGTRRTNMEGSEVKRETWHDQWAGVDQASDPGWFIRFLDMTRRAALTAIQQDPRQFYSYLDLQAGHSVLDVGCGTGDLTRPIADLVGPSGRVVGVDYSQTMVAEARHRAQEEGSPVEFVQGDIHKLAFPDATFDRAQVRLVFQHLHDPLPPLNELLRVLKPGGRLAVAEQDWETMAIDSSNKALTRKLANLFCDLLPNGWIGRQLPRLFKAAGLLEVSVTGNTAILPTYGMVEQALGLTHVLRKLEELGQATP